MDNEKVNIFGEEYKLEDIIGEFNSYNSTVNEKMERKIQQTFPIVQGICSVKINGYHIGKHIESGRRACKIYPDYLVLDRIGTWILITGIRKGWRVVHRCIIDGKNTSLNLKSFVTIGVINKFEEMVKV